MNNKGSDFPWRIQRARVRTAFTLLELVVSLATAALLFVGLGSTILIARLVATTPHGPGNTVITARGLQELRDELQFATRVLERSPQSVRFVVPDLTGDGIEDAVRYAWSGTPGDPLLRTLNGQAPRIVAEDVQAFSLDYDLETVTERFVPTRETDEVLLDSHDLPVSSSDESVDLDHWVGQYFHPSRFRDTILPTNARHWSITRVELLAYSPTVPVGTVTSRTYLASIDEKPVGNWQSPISFMSVAVPANPAWKSFAVPITGLAPYEGACLVFAGDTAGSSQMLLRSDGGSSGLILSTSQGATWSHPTGSLLYRLYGRYVVAENPVTLTRHFLQRLRVTYRVGKHVEANLRSEVLLRPAPEVVGNWWLAGFSEDPTNTDRNFDGVADWIRQDGQSFNQASLADGVWHANTRLENRPGHDFAGTTTVRIRFRNAALGGDGALFEMRVDGGYAPLLLRLQLKPDGTQELALFNHPNGASASPLATVSNLTNGFVEVRLVVAAEHDMVHLRVQGADHGAYTYTTFAPVPSDRFVSLYPSGSQAEFDYVSIWTSEDQAGN